MSAVTSFGHGREQQIEKLTLQLTAELAENKKTAEHPRSPVATSDYAAGRAQVCSDILSRLADLKEGNRCLRS